MQGIQMSLCLQLDPVQHAFIVQTSFHQFMEVSLESPFLGQQLMLFKLQLLGMFLQQVNSCFEPEVARVH